MDNCSGFDVMKGKSSFLYVTSVRFFGYPRARLLKRKSVSSELERLNGRFKSLSDFCFNGCRLRATVNC